MIFAQVLEEFLKQKGIKQKDLATRAGLTTGYVNHLLTGKRKAPSEDTVRKLADALQLDSKDRAQLFKEAGHPLEVSLLESKVSASKVNQREANSFKAEWGEVPNIQMFRGRGNELKDLKQWIVDDKCQMICILGMGGIGKTLLAAKITEMV